MVWVHGDGQVALNYSGQHQGSNRANAPLCNTSALDSQPHIQPRSASSVLIKRPGFLLRGGLSEIAENQCTRLL